MGEHQYKKGDRVRRVFEDSQVPIGTLGTVADVSGGAVYVNFDNGLLGHYCYASRIEPLTDTPAEPAPHYAQWRQASPEEMARLVDQQYRAIGAQQMAQQMAQQQRAAPGPCINHITHERARELIDQAIRKETDGLRSERDRLKRDIEILSQGKLNQSDLLGERDQLKERLAFAEDDVRWYRREVVRLGGSVRPERKR